MSLLRFIVLLSIKVFARLFYRFDLAWVGQRPSSRHWDDISLALILNHTSTKPTKSHLLASQALKTLRPFSSDFMVSAKPSSFIQKSRFSSCGSCSPTIGLLCAAKSFHGLKLFSLQSSLDPPSAKAT
jgi:hypothetical protein